MGIMAKLKRLLQGDDGLPTTISMVLARDDCSRLLAHFAETDLKRCSKLVLVWQNGAGITVESSDSVSQIEALGMLRLAVGMVEGKHGPA